MANIYGSIILNDSNAEKDKLYISGDKNLIGLIIALVDQDLVLDPVMNSKSAYMKTLKNPPNNITLKLGDERINKEILISALQFAGIQ